MSNEKTYDESAIRILEGLDPVRLRPGQFTRTDSPLHIVQEVLDNAIDEAIAGFAQTVEVSLLPDGFIRISDDGRGIPVGIHPEKGLPVIEAIFTVLYSGGKFDKGKGGAYGYAGGLHGVGVSVTNALSESLVAEVFREGKHWRIGFEDGRVTMPLTCVGKAARTRGTAITLKPRASYFDSPEIPVEELSELLKSKAVLLSGLKVVFKDARKADSVVENVFQYREGLSGYLAELSRGDFVVPAFAGSGYVAEDDEEEATGFSPGEGAEWAFSWQESGEGAGRSFVNLIPTPQHGTHVAGLKSALFVALKTFIEFQGLLPKGLKLSADDAYRGLRFVLSLRLLDPGFDNQTKDRLNSREAVKLVEKFVRPSVEAWLNHNPAQAKNIADLVIRNATTRQKLAVKSERRKNSSVVMLPGKLADCESSNAVESELFLVEGDSAGGSAKQARIKETQAILPLRGKSLNVWEKTGEQALQNAEISDISTAIGVRPHSSVEAGDLERLRYGKICILADADVDGFHIQTLLLTLFFKHFPALVARGHVYIACPPLFRIDAEASGKKRPARKIYAMDANELRHTEEKLRKEGYKTWRVGRFKGLGEMDPPELWETTLCPDTRRLEQVSLPEELTVEATEMFENLMGRSKSAWRREWMERRGNEIQTY